MCRPVKPAPQSRQGAYPALLQVSLCPFVTTPFSPFWFPPTPQATTDLLSDTAGESAFSRILYKQNHTVFTPYCLASATLHNCFEIHSCSCMYQQLLPFTDKEHFIIWMYHFLSIYLLMETTKLVVSSLGYNKAAMNILKNNNNNRKYEQNITHEGGRQ